MIEPVRITPLRGASWHCPVVGQYRGRGSVEPVTQRRGNNVKGVRDFCLKAKARIWPRLSCMCHIRSTAVLLSPLARPLLLLDASFLGLLGNRCLRFCSGAHAGRNWHATLLTEIYYALTNFSCSIRKTNPRVVLLLPQGQPPQNLPGPYRGLQKDFLHISEVDNS